MNEIIFKLHSLVDNCIRTSRKLLFQVAVMVKLNDASFVQFETAVQVRFETAVQVRLKTVYDDDDGHEIISSYDYNIKLDFLTDDSEQNTCLFSWILDFCTEHRCIILAVQCRGHLE